MVKSLLLAGLCALVLAGRASAEDPNANGESQEAMPRMKEYYIVLLNHGPNRDQPDSVVQTMQAAHLANIDRLWKERKAIIAGPFGDGSGGLIIMTNTTLEEARQLVGRDPMVKAGRLVADIRSWWAQEGILPEPSPPDSVENH